MKNSLTLDSEMIVGIDLGTTNSEAAIFSNGNIVVVSFEGETIMPSVVSLAPDGKLLVGTQARNQRLLFPERTVVSVKRQMGFDEEIPLGDKKFRPQEISAMILRELKTRAELFAGRPINRCVITVPAYFSDSQRQATHDAGVIAGFKVERIINEPTAASLAFAAEPGKSRRVLVYDLGGGTFDVSIVETRDGVTEVLASHGDPRLGGDDFDRLLLNEIVEALIRDGNPDIRSNSVAMSRLTTAAIAAKHELSHAPFAKILEENLLQKNGLPVNFSMEISRERYEELVNPLIEKTFISVSQALSDANCRASDLDAVIPVGGMTRTPLILKRLEETLGRVPRQDVHPDLAVATGAGIMAARLSGHDEGKVLVDITPYSFGPMVASEGSLGLPIWNAFSPVIKKGTPLPVRKTEVYYTMVDNQTAWNCEIYQGEHQLVDHNIRIGKFTADGFSNLPAGNKILCTLELDLNGILHVTVVEKATGLSKRVRIENALGAMAGKDLDNARANLDGFFGPNRPQATENERSFIHEMEQLLPKHAEAAAGSNDNEPSYKVKARQLLARAMAARNAVTPEDLAEYETLTAGLSSSLENGSETDINAAVRELDNLLYFIEEA